MPAFIAIDGEGLTRADDTSPPPHDYVLLAASDGSYLEDYETPGGLDTESCFEYLLDLAERDWERAKSDGVKPSILVGFYTSYDVNMIFRDLPEYVLAGLWEGRTMTWRAHEGDYRQYRIEYIPNRVLRVKQGCWTMADGDDKAHWRTFRSVTWWDCFQFFQMSFVKALRDWEATDPATIDSIASMKDARGTFELDQRESIRAYCQDECRLLVGLMSKVAATLEALEISLTSWYGAGSIAAALYKKYGVKHHLKQSWRGALACSEDDEELENAIMHAYFGGRVETFAVGIVAGSCVNYDVRSAYPAATATLPSLSDCLVQRVAYYDYNERYALWRVDWSKVGVQPSRLTPFPFRHNKRIYWPHSGSGWYHAEEVRAAMDVFGDGKRIRITVREGYRFIPSNNARPFEWVPDLYAERAEFKRNHDPREKILKLGLNSLYGKTAQSIGGKDGSPPPFQCYLWAGMITADCRAKLLRAASRSDSVLAIATDGLFVGEPIDGLEESDELGAWESVTVEPGLMLIQPGVYATPSLGRKRDDGLGSFAKSRGFSARGIDYAQLSAAWRERRMAASMTMPETRFIGFGYALAVGKLDTLWRRWVAGDKTIHFSGTTSKSFDPTGNNDAELVRLVAPAAPGELSAPYVPRTRSKDDAREYELQSELLASQPDLEDNPFTWRE